MSLRICLVTENFHPETVGAVPITLSQLARHLRDAYPDIALDVVTSANPRIASTRKFAAYEDWDGIRIFRVDSPRSKRPSMALRLMLGWIFCAMALRVVRRLHRDAPYDIVCHGTNPPSSPLVGTALLSQGAASVYMLHDLYPEVAIELGRLRESGVPARIGRWFQQRWLGSASAVVVIGRCMAARLRESYRIDAAKIHLIENWSDPAIVAAPDTQTAFRAAHGLEGFLVVYSGNIGFAHRLGDVLDAAKAVRRGDITFVIVGSGSMLDAIARRIRDEAISNVRLLPPVPLDAYPDLLASADVSLVTLDPALDGLAVPSKLYNILASGRPVVALMAQTSEVALVLREQDCGVAADDGEGLARAVLALRDSPPERLDRMGRNARAALEAHYTLAQSAEKFHRLFRALTDGRGPSR